MAAFLFPYYPCKYERLSKTHLVVPLIIKESIKLSNHDSEHTETIFRAVEKVMPLANKKLDKTDPKTRVELGLIIRTIGPLWHLAILFTAAVEMTLGKPTADAFSEYTHLIDTVTQLGLDNAYSLKHVLDGKAVSVLLKLKPGPQIKETLDVVMEWQLEHPTGTAEECKKHILALKSNSDS
ncbi:putative CCA tRNA nucleotidyltransferase 2 [Zancudomyces culisetae]|uniref:Putative CCA tRNA nucleotidyltransferase 2 n=1 Tax=Zancudomyces culisetae TaxID=1213189 RepID=A0A1R1PEX0_ZANCU|nr:putative CCA tRNA nucleotidyltransferase 2 [Zancudomyces culisetae]OMH81761.1 putative CCA tRNA nucleotidyltransferase 2 [Zancudomyces culisetae]|eukprot:OMH79545.1 putative CCA tRNA nucleotidyltransferase 2 [Zancudomyces culisetae]